MNFSWSLVFALAFNPPQSWMKSTNLSRVQPRRSNATSAGYLRSPSWSRCHLPWVAVWRAFTLLNAVHMLLHLSPHWPLLPALPDWLRLSSIICCWIGPGIRINGETEEWPWTHLSHQKQTPYRVEGGIKFHNLWMSIYESCKVLDLKQSLFAHPCLSSAWHEINYTPVKWAFLSPISLLTSWG